MGRARMSGRIEELVARLARRHERRARLAFADSLERVVGEVDAPFRRGGAAVPIDRPAVAEAAPLLLQIATLLRAPGPVPAAAIGEVRSLLGAGAGPLYSCSPHRSEYPPGTLACAAREILAACQDPVPVHEPGELVRA
jgi:hypothetical protein